MKKICIITQCSLPVPTTKGGAVETLVEYLLDQNELTPYYNFTVIAVKDDRAVEIAKQYKYSRFVYLDDKELGFIDKLWYQMYRVLKHTHIYIPFSRAFMNVLKVLKKIETHDLYLFEAGPTTQIPLLSRVVGRDKLIVHLHWDGMGTHRMANNCHKVIAISEYISKCWETQSQSNNVTVVENCVNLSAFNKPVSQEEQVKLRQKMGLRNEDKVVLFVGRIVQEKGICELIQAFERVTDNNAVLMIIGSSNFGKSTNTPYEQEVSNLIKNSKKRILFTGFIHQTELYKYYSIATCSVMPSQFQEPAGLVALEAQATGTPLIATDVGGLGEYCSSESTILVKKDELQIENIKRAITELISDQDRCFVMGEKGKIFAANFDTKNYFEKFMSVFDA